jgi:N-methylhydantoinase A
MRGPELTAERISAEVSELAATARQGLDGAELEVTYELRYRGQAFELPIPGPAEPELSALAEAFAREHEARYGYRDPDAELELVNVRVAAVLPGPEPSPRAAKGELEEGSRQVHFGGEWVEARILRGEPGAGLAASGPAIFELPEATLVLPAGWAADVDGSGTILCEGAPRRSRGATR